jgi:Protein of unknown function (DUF732)
MNRLAVALAAVWAIWTAVPAAADPGAVQTLTPSRASKPALDEQFLADLASAGIRVTDVSVAVYGAHDTCAYLAAGHDAEDAVEQGLRNNSTMTRTDEIAYIDAAIDIYCPRYVKMTGTMA